MKTSKILLAILLATSTALAANMMDKPVAANAEVEQAYKEIREAFGMVPTFLRLYPQEALPGAWADMKAIELNPNSAIPSKYKDLIGLAVAAQVPCVYCTYFHTKAAEVSGATTDEVKEAVAMAGLTRKWSTWLNGNRFNEDEFKRETSDSIAFIKKQMEPNAEQAAPVEVVDAPSAYRDMEITFGRVPSFLRAYPQTAIVGAWKGMKAIQFNPKGAVSPKYKELIGVAVAAQIPCQYCVFFHTEAAKLNGATSEEIGEAIYVAAEVRQWSTVLNGLQINEKTFKSEADQMFRYIRNQERVRKLGKVTQMAGRLSP